MLFLHDIESQTIEMCGDFEVVQAMLHPEERSEFKDRLNPIVGSLWG